MQNVEGKQKWVLRLVGSGPFQKVVGERGLDDGDTWYFQGQLWELRGAKDPGGALEKGMSGLKAQGGQDNEGQLVLTLTNGQEVTGLLEEENDEALILRTSDAEPLEVAHSRIKTRRNLPSGMPAMGKMISKRELRDLIEYLSNLKTKE